MKRIITLTSLLVLAFFAFNCGGPKGPDPIPIENLENYADPVAKFEIMYPTNWDNPAITTGRRLNVLSAPLARARFGKYEPEGFPGAQIDLNVVVLDSTKTWQDVAEDSKMFSPEVYKKEDVTIDGVQGWKYTYEFPLVDGIFKGEMYVAAKDSGRATVIRFEAFANTFEELYRPKFDEIIKNVKLAKTPQPRTMTADTIFEEADPPSMEMNTRSGDGFEIGIPDNFQSENLGKTPGAEKTYNYMGMRRGDSFIRIDIFDSKDQSDLAKIVEENKSAYGSKPLPKEVTIANKKAYMIDYRATTEVSGRVWFVLHKQKLYRITINWFVPEQSDFLPPFEKSVSTIKFK